MNKIRFSKDFASILPDTYRIISTSNFHIHPCVSKIILHGSRGIAGGFRSNSDIDLSLIIDQFVDNRENSADDLRRIINLTLNAWTSSIELDIAVLFDVQGCGLACFDQMTWRDGLCTGSGVDCFGLFKTQKGYSGFVENAGIEVRKMYPCVKIWDRELNG